MMPATIVEADDTVNAWTWRDEESGVARGALAASR